jgi:hypothetical protein
MDMFRSFFAALNEADVRYVVVGGLAVVLHGHARLTADIDLAIDLEPASAAHAIATLSSMGLRPRASVPAESFADPEVRADWVRNRGMRVFNMVDPRNPLRSVDLFAELPIPFDQLWERSLRIDLLGTFVRVASIPDLIAMKENTGRAQDLADIKQLEAIRRRGGKHGRG